MSDESYDLKTKEPNSNSYDMRGIEAALWNIASQLCDIKEAVREGFPLLEYVLRNKL